jgi:hypothetical protein
MTPGFIIEFYLSVGGPAYQYQWMRDQVDILGADSSMYTINSIEVTDVGC